MNCARYYDLQFVDAFLQFIYNKCAVSVTKVCFKRPPFVMWRQGVFYSLTFAGVIS